MVAGSETVLCAGRMPGVAVSEATGGGMVTDCWFEDGALCRIAVGCCGAGRIPCCRVYCGPHGLTVIAVGGFGGVLWGCRGCCGTGGCGRFRAASRTMPLGPERGFPGGRVHGEGRLVLFGTIATQPNPRI